MGTVTGMVSRWEEAYLEVQEVRPDIILADLTLSAAKTIAYIQRVKETVTGTEVIILSQANDMEAVNMAYEKGARLLIHKPFCEIEVRNVLHSVEMARAMEWIIGRARDGMPQAGVLAGDRRQDCQAQSTRKTGADPGLGQPIRRLKGIMQEIGIFSEAGSKDIIRIMRYLIEQEMDLRDITLQDLCSSMGQNSKSVEQRIRRAALAGMANLASRGMDDCGDPVFNEYGARLYSLEQVKREMSYIRGKSDKHGSVRIRKFLGSLLVYCREL